MKLKVVLHQEEEGGYSVEVPALPGCISEGDTLAEALANIKEAAEGWLQAVAGQTEAEAEAGARVEEIEL
jgi:predicted RNase H-like HicB family nuclease